jgi:hypothetical protein
MHIRGEISKKNGPKTKNETCYDFVVRLFNVLLDRNHILASAGTFQLAHRAANLLWLRTIHKLHEAESGLTELVGSDLAKKGELDHAYLMSLCQNCKADSHAYPFMQNVCRCCLALSESCGVSWRELHRGQPTPRTSSLRWFVEPCCFPSGKSFIELRWELRRFSRPSSVRDLQKRRLPRSRCATRWPTIMAGTHLYRVSFIDWTLILHS